MKIECIGGSFAELGDGIELEAWRILKIVSLGKEDLQMFADYLANNGYTVTKNNNETK